MVGDEGEEKEVAGTSLFSLLFFVPRKRTKFAGLVLVFFLTDRCRGKTCVFVGSFRNSGNPTLSFNRPNAEVVVPC